MNFQEKMLEATQDLRARAATLAQSALLTAREQAGVAARRAEKRVGALKVSLKTLGVAGRELEKVARRHGVKFVKQNTTIAQAARKDVTSLALTTLDAIAKRAATDTKSKRATAKKPRASVRKTTTRARVAKAA
jgi:hypothetical protein